MNNLLKQYVVLHFFVNMAYFPPLIRCQEVQNKIQDPIGRVISCQEVQNKIQDPIGRALFVSEQMCFSEFVILFEVQTRLLNLFKTEAARQTEQDDSENNQDQELTHLLGPITRG